MRTLPALILGIVAQGAPTTPPAAGRVAPDAPFVARGRVVDAKGKAVGGASVTLSRTEGGDVVAWTEAKSDAAGAFAIEAKNGPGEWNVSASRIPIGSCQIHGIRTDWNPVELGPIVLRKMVSFAGRVTNEKGEPIAGAKVFVGDFPTETDGEGRYSVLFGVWPGQVDVAVVAKRYADGVRRGVIAAKDPKDVNIVLERESPFAGRVVDDTGVAVEHAKVFVRRRESSERIGHEPVWTDDVGHFAARGLPASPSDYVCAASKLGNLPGQVDASEILLGRPIVLRRGKVVTVRVDPSTPITRLEIQAMTKVGEGWTNESVTVDPEERHGFWRGVVRATAPPGQVYRAFATLRGGALAASAHVEAAKAPSGVLEIVVPVSSAASAPSASMPVASMPAASKPAPDKTSRVTGKLAYGVAPPGEEVPIAAFRAVTLEGGRGRKIEYVGMALAAADGSFAFEALPPGRIALVPKRPVTASGGAVRSFEDEFPPFQETGWQKIATIPADGAPVVFDFSIARPQERFVTGSVYVRDRPASDCLVELIPRKGSAGAGSDATDERGRYRIPLLKPGEYDLRVRHRMFTETRRIQVTDGQSRQVNFDLALGGVEGSVVLDDRDLFLTVRVLLQRERDAQRDPLWRWVSPEVETGADGRFSFPVLAAGRYRVLVHDPRHRFATVASDPFEATAGSQQSIPTIHVPKEVPLRVSAREKGGGPGTGRVWVTAAAGTPRLVHLAQGWLFAQREFLTIHGLAPGTYRVRMPGYFDEEATLATGAPAQVRFQRQRPESEPAPAADSAYHSPEAEDEKRWDWAGEVPSLYEQEDP